MARNPACPHSVTIRRRSMKPETGMNSNRKLWIGLSILLVVSFSVLIWVGTEIHRVMPPIPAQVVDGHGRVLYTRADIEKGRQVWQSIGGHQLGSIWGHGSYVAPDWSADWLHREAVASLDFEAQRLNSVSHAELGADQRAAAVARLTPRMRRNTYDASTDTLTVDPERALAIQAVANHYFMLFGEDSALLELRKGYAMKQNTVPDAEHRRALTAFIFWSAWAATTERPGEKVTYT